jgi:hypothetical protein
MTETLLRNLEQRPAGHVYAKQGLGIEPDPARCKRPLPGRSLNVLISPPVLEASTRWLIKARRKGCAESPDVTRATVGVAVHQASQAYECEECGVRLAEHLGRRNWSVVFLCRRVSVPRFGHPEVR